MEDLYLLRAITRTEHYLKKNKNKKKINKRKIYCDIYFIENGSAVYTAHDLMRKYSVTTVDIKLVRIHVHTNVYNLYNNYCPNLLLENWTHLFLGIQMQPKQLNITRMPGFTHMGYTSRRCKISLQLFQGAIGASLTEDIYFINHKEDNHYVYTLDEIIETYSVSQAVIEVLRDPVDIASEETTFKHNAYVLYDHQCSNLITDYKRFKKFSDAAKL